MGRHKERKDMDVEINRWLETVNQLIASYNAPGLDTTISVENEEFFEAPVSGPLPDFENIEEIMLNQISKEIFQSLCKGALRSLQKNSSDIDVKDLREMLFKLPKNATIVTNTKLGSIIQDMKGYEPSSFNELGSINSTIYSIGTLGLDRKIYVDAFMRWNEDRVIIFNENFWNWKMIAHDTKEEMVKYDNISERMSLGKIYQEIKQIENFNYNVRNAEI